MGSLTSSPGQRIGESPDASGRFVRVVERLNIYGEFLDFRELAAEVLSADTRYLVFDLDRTTHLERNIGELFGFYLSAYHSYGAEYLANADIDKTSDRIPFDWRRPAPALHQIFWGSRGWVLPGLVYLFGKKIGMRFAPTRRALQYWLGPDVISAIQRIPRTTLVHELTRLPLETLNTLARQLWRRQADTQVIHAEDITWLHEQYPQLKIIISSASPQPVLEAARMELGVDGIIYTSIEEREGRLSAPHIRYPSWKGVGQLPGRLSPPAQYHQNTSWAKLESLKNQYPDFFDPDVETVGVSDTEHGEDHPWTSCFTKVVDINSSAPFSPIIAASSPLKEIHSVDILSTEERRHREQGDIDFVSPRRTSRQHRHAHRFTRTELESILEETLSNAEKVASKIYDEAQKNQAVFTDHQSRASRFFDEITLAVSRYNEAPQKTRRGSLGKVQEALKTWRRANYDLRVQERPLARMHIHIKGIVNRARRQLDAAILKELSPTPVDIHVSDPQLASETT